MTATIFAPLPNQKFDVIVADPPWAFKTFTPDVLSDRGAEQHYSTLDVQAIKSLPVRDIAAKDCHLFLWTTAPFLEASFSVMRAWGFRFSSTGFNWIKLRQGVQVDQMSWVEPTVVGADLHTGLGATTRKGSEFCLIGRRGNPKRASGAVREVILAPVMEHSRKPEEARARIEEYAGPGASIVELFARSTRPGWTAWGNQVGRFGGVEG